MRRLIGYDRFEGEPSWRLLGMLYEISRLYVNFFQPSLKLSSKERDGGNVKRIYEQAATPHRRVAGSSHVDPETKVRLEKLFDSLDPVLLRIPEQTGRSNRTKVADQIGAIWAIEKRRQRISQGYALVGIERWTTSMDTRFCRE